MKLIIINGPNLNMVGTREPSVYGATSLKDINLKIEKFAKSRNIDIEFYQSNHEGDLIDKIHSFKGDGIIINAGALTHYSYALADALKCVDCKKIEVHMSNVHAREEFRHKSVLSSVCNGVICGFSEKSYILAVESFVI